MVEPPTHNNDHLSPADEPRVEEPQTMRAAGPHRRLISLVADPECEPAAHVSDSEGLATWAAVSALWHPALLARVEQLPMVESFDEPSAPEPGDVRLLAPGMGDRIPSGYRTQASDAGAILLEPELDADRLSLSEQVLAVLDSQATLGDADCQAVALDFMALGTARWWLRILTSAMGHVDSLDLDNLTREALAGARAWSSGDGPGATNRLRASFELLTQARERFYQVDAYLIDLCLLDPSTPSDALAETLAARAPVSLLAPARAIEVLAEREPERLNAIREAVTEGWIDVVGGAYAEVDEPLLPIESVFWQFRKGGETYRRHLDDRAVESLARRRFALYPLLPQIAKRFGFRFAIHLALDAGRFPVRTESKRLWESPDGADLETLTRPPLAADQPAHGLFLPWRVAKTMKDDHVATVALIHWPSPVAGWYIDLRRIAAYSPVLVRWVTLGDYFHRTDRPFESFQPKIDDYVTPYLAQAVARHDTEPISRRAVHARLRARLDSQSWVRALGRALSASAGKSAPNDHEWSTWEEALETERLAEFSAELDRNESASVQELVHGILGTSTTGRPGYLVLNPLGLPRRAAVLLPDAAADLRPEGPLRASQFTEDGVWAVVDLPAHGYAWVPRERAHDASPAPVGVLSVRGRTLRSDLIEVEIDNTTGGLRSVRAAGEGSARLGQQLVMTGLQNPDGTLSISQMHADGLDVDYGGPALVQAVSRGRLLDPRDNRTLASFRQRYRLWVGRPVLELEISLTDIDPAWLVRAADSDPWVQNIACRWAWPDSEATLRRLSLLHVESTHADRPETPDAFDISTRRQRTALVLGGLAHHQRRGQRMLDTLLIAGRETCRSFRLGVALDIEHPFHSAQDMLTPALVVATDAGPPRSGPAGWFFEIDNRAVATTHVAFAHHSGDGRGWGLVFHLMETAGRPARCRLRLFRNPTWARQTDFNDQVILDLPIDDDAVLIDLTPHEIVCIEVTLGSIPQAERELDHDV
jgi:alpha-mannosidase